MSPDRDPYHIDLRSPIPKRVITLINTRGWEWLEGLERELVERVVFDRQPVGKVAEDLGIYHRTIQSRLNIIVQRMRTREYVWVLSRGIGPYTKWSPTKVGVGVATFIQGRSMRDTAAHLGIKVHVVRRWKYLIRRECRAHLSRSKR